MALTHGRYVELGTDSKVKKEITSESLNELVIHALTHRTLTRKEHVYVPAVDSAVNLRTTISHLPVVRPSFY